MRQRKPRSLEDCHVVLLALANLSSARPEVRERALRVVLEHANQYLPQWEAITSIASKIGCAGETLPQ